MPGVLLTHSNHVYSDPKQTAKMQPYPPLQTILAAAALRTRGIEASLFDPALQDPESGFRAALEQYRPDLVAICEDDFNYITKMCLARNRDLAFRMARTAAESGIPVVAHGSDASDHAREYLDAGFDAVLIGTVEQTLIEWAQGISRHSIPGTAFRWGGSIHFTAPRPVKPDLDRLPLPAWDLVDIETYRRAWTSAHGYFSLNMASSRGCPYRCNWCAKPVYGNQYHVRSAASVAGEMLLLKRAFRPDHLWFADDIFALSPKWTLQFGDAVERLGARIPFRMQSRCDLMTRATAGALRQSGCAEVWMGAESGSQRILDAMEKGIRVHQTYEAAENLRRHGIRVCLFLQFGYPGEEWTDIEATIRMVRNIRPDDAGISVSYPLPGTKFHRIVSASIGKKANWVDSADLTMLYQGSYSTEFYRALTDAIHAEVRGEAGQGAAWERVSDLRAAAELIEVV
ncbi:MAG TPA: radical SAM protein [Bryobacteraceae bacterium]|nr:radical SAM protein [Bryobacteraceae bacterium]